MNRRAQVTQQAFWADGVLLRVPANRRLRSLTVAIEASRAVAGRVIASTSGGGSSLEIDCRHTDSAVVINARLFVTGFDEPLLLKSRPTDGSSKPVSIVVRLADAQVDLIVDGVFADREWPLGDVEVGELDTWVAEDVGSAFLFDRALSDDEIEILRDGPLTRVTETGANGPLLYWEPSGSQYHVGDCMPFAFNNTLHLFYLLDRRRHQSKGRLGAHQWAHASTTDLVRWTHHPVAVPIDEQWEGSICTGSLVVHEGVTYAFYAVRMSDRVSSPVLTWAESADGISFRKSGTRVGGRMTRRCREGNY